MFNIDAGELNRQVKTGSGNPGRSERFSAEAGQNHGSRNSDPSYTWDLINSTPKEKFSRQTDFDTFR
jgi:hypothetical protein